MKLYKATISFAGNVCMAIGEEKRLADKDAASLIDCGYIKPVEESYGETTETTSETAETVIETTETTSEITASKSAKKSKNKKK